MLDGDATPVDDDPPRNDPRVDEATTEVDRHDARQRGEADRDPTPDEEAAADRAAQGVPRSVGDHYEEMIQLGADVKGEGRIEP